MAHLVVKIDRQAHELTISSGESVLDCALKHNLDAPYSCMEGVCTACMAQIVEGEVDFPDDTILDEQDRKEGRTLTCQAKIKAGCEKLVIDYDAI